jgi:hypothetical protein
MQRASQGQKHTRPAHTKETIVKTLIGATIALTLLASTAAVAQRDGRDHQSQTSDHPTPASHGYQSWPKLPFCKPLNGDHNALMVCATNRHTGLHCYNDRDIRDSSSRMTEYRMQAEFRNDEGVA